MRQLLGSPIVIVIGTQLLFTTGDFIARTNLRGKPFSLATFLSWWFLAYMTMRQVATFGQLYVFTTVQLGKTMAMFGAISILTANLLGFLFLGEVLSGRAYLGVALAAMAFAALASAR